MAQMSTADFLTSQGNRPTVNMPPPLVNQWAYPDATETVKVRLRELLAGGALYSVDSTFAPPAVGSKLAETAMTKMYPQHRVTTIASNNAVVTVIGTLAIGSGAISGITTARVNDEWVSSITSTVFLADAPIGDDMHSDTENLPLVPGTRVELKGRPTAVTLRGRTGKVVREDEDDRDYVIVRLDAPAVYHHLNSEDEELPEIVVMTDNLRALGH